MLNGFFVSASSTVYKVVKYSDFTRAFGMDSTGDVNDSLYQVNRVDPSKFHAGADPNYTQLFLTGDAVA
jgi:hypothetical protein